MDSESDSVRRAEQGARPLRQGLYRFGLAGLLALTSWSAAPQTPPPDPADPADDDPPITLPAADDPDIAQSLERRLAYTQSLAESDDGDCTARLSEVQRQHDLAAADPSLDILISQGQARLANIEYRLHLGRASCGAGAAPRKDELLAAIDAAWRGVSLYRAGYDYASMAVMQYGVAAGWRLLGDTDKAVAALEATIAMDAEFGFAEDAEDNSKVLQGWKGQAVDAAQTLSPIPKRSVTLKFAWEPRDADVTVQADYLGLEGGRPVHGTASTRLIRHIRADEDGWVLSSEATDRRYNFGDWQDRSAKSMVRTIVAQAAEQMWPPDLKVGSDGGFKDTVEPAGTAVALTDDVNKVSRELQLDREADVDLTSAFGRSMQLLAQPAGIRAKAAEDYTLAISAWIDATLDQGVWYEMKAPLLLPGIATLVDHDIQFAYARPVPCTSPATEANCAEILVHATPDQDDLKERLDYMQRGLRLKQPIRYAAATDLRLVVDPARLLTHASDLRRHWYLGIDGKGEPLVGAEKVVSTWMYR